MSEPLEPDPSQPADGDTEEVDAVVVVALGAGRRACDPRGADAVVPAVQAAAVAATSFVAGAAAAGLVHRRRQRRELVRGGARRRARAHGRGPHAARRGARARLQRGGWASWCRSWAAARCWWTCTCSVAATNAGAVSVAVRPAGAPRVQGQGREPVELRVEARPVWPFRLPAQSGMDGVLRRRGGVLERLLHHGEEPVVVRVAQSAPDRVLFGARAPTSEAAAEYGIARMRFALGVDEDLRAFQRALRARPVDRTPRCAAARGCGCDAARSRGRRWRGRSASS